MAARKRAAAKRAAKKPAAKRAPASQVDLRELGGAVVSVFGPFNAYALIRVRAEVAQQLFGEGSLKDARPSEVVDAAMRDVAAIGERDEALGESALAAAVVALAMEVADPYNSATSKSMCVREMREVLEELRGLLPPVKTQDGVDDLARARAARRRAAAG